MRTSLISVAAASRLVRLARFQRLVTVLFEPRTDTPEINPRPVPLFTDCAGQTLSDLQKALLAGAARRVAQSANELMDLSAIETTEQATAALDEREARVRATRVRSQN